MINHNDNCYKLFFTIFPSSVPQVQNKCRKNIVTSVPVSHQRRPGNGGRTPALPRYRLIGPSCSSSAGSVYRAEVTFLIPIGEMDIFSLVLLFCAVILVTVLFLFQKAATNNTLIPKDCLCNVVK